MSQLNALVSGAGIAGSVVAYWLGKAGFNVTVIERANGFRSSGQGVDLRGSGLAIIKRMGVEAEIRAQTTKETGMKWIDENNHNLATLGVQGDQNFTAEIEIIRYDLAKILYDASLTTGKVHYEFGCSITALNQSKSNVTVELSNGQTKDYDIVIAADGFGSKTRNLIIDPEKSKSCVKSLNAHCAYFSIPHEDQDSPHSRWYATTGGRSILLRPIPGNKSSAYMNIISDNPKVHEAQASHDIETQKAFLKSLFKDAGWEAPRILRELENVGPDNFYFQEVGQIILDPSLWHQGRCVMVGDAAYCPSSFTGMGTTLAIVGAYVLAGEISIQAKNGATADFEAAFRKYEDRLGNWVKGTQKLPLDGAIVKMLNPQTSWGVWILRTILWVFDRSGLFSLGGLFGSIDSGGIEVPGYDI